MLGLQAARVSVRSGHCRPRRGSCAWGSHQGGAGCCTRGDEGRTIKQPEMTRRSAGRERRMNSRASIPHLALGTLTIWILLLVGGPPGARAQAPGGKPPNILVILGDDV